MSQGRDFDADPWTPDQPRLEGVARTAFYVNLLTEDNLPSYHRIVYEHFGRPDSPWMNWVHRWTAEEGRHSIVLRDYLVVTRNEDPVKFERGHAGGRERLRDRRRERQAAHHGVRGVPGTGDTHLASQHRPLLG